MTPVNWEDEAMNWRWRLVRWWVRWNLERDGASRETVETALKYVAVSWSIQQLVKAGLDDKSKTVQEGE